MLTTLSRFIRIGMQDTEMDCPSRNALLDIIENRRLTALFQPIIDYRDHSYFGFEGLIRGPAESLLNTPLALFSTAEQYGLRS